MFCILENMFKHRLAYNRKAHLYAHFLENGNKGSVWYHAAIQ